MRLLFSIILLSFFATCFGSDLKYPVNEIPEEVKKGMYAIIREKEVTFEINSINSSKSYFRIAITILNENANEQARKVVGYDKLRTVKLFKCTSYDAEGNVIKRLKANEIRDISAYDGFSLYSDYRMKIADLSQNTYPYTVEFEYEVESKLLYSIPDFYLYNDDEIFTQKSIYKIIYPGGLKPRYKLFKIPGPQVQVLDKKEA